MEKHLFSNEALSHLRFIREYSPVRIWFEYIQYVFEYENFHFTLAIEAAETIVFKEPVMTQFAMKTVMTRIDEPFVSQENSQLITENKNVSTIEIIRTKLLFSKVKQISQHLYESAVTQLNPHENLPQNIDIKKSVIVDVGICLTIESNQFLNLFINDNDEDFYSNAFHNQKGDFRETLASKYQFIDLN